MNTFTIAFKHIPFGCEFEHNGQKYTKTNFNRGYFYNEINRKVFKIFKKRTIVETTNEIFDWS